MTANFNFRPQGVNPTTGLKSNQHKVKMSNALPIFLVIATVNTKAFPKTAWQGLSKNGYEKVVKVMAS